MVITAGASGCMATRKFTRNEVKASADQLTTKIDANSSEIKETQDNVKQVNDKVTGVDARLTTVDQKYDQRVAGVDTKVAELDTKTTQNVGALRGDLQNVNGKVDTATNKADEANKSVGTLGARFDKRNSYEMSTQKAVQFAFDSANLTANGKTQLDEIAAELMSNPNGLLVLEGHTDNTGDSAYNIALGERRVNAVRRYLAVEKGVPPYRIEQVSFGADKPIAPNNSRQGREQNRAVTLSLMVPAMEISASAANRQDD